MKTLKYRSSGNDVYVLQELLVLLGYDIDVTSYFDMKTHNAILNFQEKNNLVIDGIVGPKSWAKLLEKPKSIIAYNDKFLSEKDLIDFAQRYQLELAAVKAVNEIESNGKGFLLDGRPRILFEGHVFWKELEKRNIKPSDYQNTKTENILYKSWTKKYYQGGGKEYLRLNKAASLSEEQDIHDAAFCSASYGAFQIMGYHFKSLGYPNVDSFVAHMYTHEKAHLEAFGLFCEVNNLIPYLKNKNWAEFARRYNGSGYKENKYDTKLESAYNKYLKM